MAVTLGTSEEAVEQAARTVRDGGTVIYPTETCYGIGCDATDEDAIERVYDIKERPRNKGLTAIVGSRAMAEQYCQLSDEERALVEAFMPGPLTLVAEKRSNVPDVLNPDFAFRIPGNETGRWLAEEAGAPVVATSANVSGGEANYRVEDIDPGIRETVDIVLDGGALEGRQPSTIVRVVDGDIDILRDGPVGRDAIADALSSRS